MTNKKNLSRIPVIVLVFVLVGFAGCGTAPQVGLPAQAGGGQSGGGSGTENGRAAQLAADLGKAVNGATVRLTDRVEIKTAITVPEGVTLDLTADGAEIELQDGAVLTVNGTVNATGHGDHGSGWVEGSLRIGDGTTAINGGGTIYLKSKGRLLNLGSDKGRRQLTLDGVTLVGLPDNDNPLVGIYENGGLVLKSGAITGNTHVSSEETTGGGIDVGEDGSFTMQGGAIFGNTATSDTLVAGGGGVAVWKGTFIMSGGTITNNTATSGGRNANGGGVFLHGNAAFTMSGGEISGNTATSGSGGGQGGGVDLRDAIFTMSGGTISGNTGGGVTVSGKIGSTFTMQGGMISGNTARTDCGGVTVIDGMFIMEGGTIYGKADSLPAGTDASLANNSQKGASSVLHMRKDTATVKWGTGGTYTKGGVSQTGGSDIGTTSDTLIAVP
jgi:hypothetical protein